jgi:transposase InsO family protein
MVGDITYIFHVAGMGLPGDVIDCYSKRIVGWAILHSDRGSNYTSGQFAKTLKKHDIRHSVGRTGICYDNAMAE